MSTQTKQIRLEFPGNNFAGIYAAEAWLRERGFSYGSMQMDSPIGILYGDFSISKWRNLRPSDIAALHGRMLPLNGSYRDGGAVVLLDANAGRAQ